MRACLSHLLFINFVRLALSLSLSFFLCLGMLIVNGVHWQDSTGHWCLEWGGTCRGNQVCLSLALSPQWLRIWDTSFFVSLSLEVICIHAGNLWKFKLCLYPKLARGRGLRLCLATGQGMGCFVNSTHVACLLSKYYVPCVPLPLGESIGRWIIDTCDNDWMCRWIWEQVVIGGDHSNNLCRTNIILVVTTPLKKHIVKLLFLCESLANIFKS